eukprot:GHUV01014525.1.p1 GENE.GHUV01014525.1~~GHUV01014525.1.p1  ORF type:complete len:236 (+),score=75.18 GHUV01014525.1:442-1149(+)
MASRKRSFGADVAGDVMVGCCNDGMMTDGSRCFMDAQVCSKDQHKRVQTSRCAVGSMSEQDIAQFIHQLSPHLSANPSVLQTHAGLDAAGLQAFAELNTVLHQHFMHMSGSMLRGYHSFTTTDRQSLWVNYAKAYGVTESAAKAPVSSPQQYQPQHLQLVRFLLEWVVQEQASVTEYEVSLPHWLIGYGARWGFGSSGVISLLVMQAYKRLDPACSRTTSSRQPAYRIFVPMLAS